MPETNRTEGWCEHIIEYPLYCLDTTVMEGNQWCLQAGNAAQSTCQFFGLLALLIYLKRQRYKKNTSRILLPIYEVYSRALFVIMALFSVLQLTDSIGFIARPPHPGNAWSFVIIGITWGGYHVLLEGVVVLLLSRTLGSRTLRRVKRLSVAWFIITFLLVGGSAYLGTNNQLAWKDTLGLALFELWNVTLFIFYVVVALFPQRLIPCHRRPSAKTFAIFFMCVRAGNLIADIFTNVFHTPFEYRPSHHHNKSYYSPTIVTTPSSIIHHNHDTARTWFDFGYCLNFACTGIFFSVMVPVIVYFALLKDSLHWRGDAKLASSTFQSNRRDATISDIRTPLMGLDLNSGEVSVVHRNMEHVPENLLIDFYELSLNPMNCLGTGGTARVYRGVLRGKKKHICISFLSSNIYFFNIVFSLTIVSQPLLKGKPVAIKMLVCVELTQELVKSFFQEAVTLSVLSKCHPNIVDVNGICVAPPALCIVLELCAGSLFDAWNETRDSKSRSDSLKKVRTQYKNSTLKVRIKERHSKSTGNRSMSSNVSSSSFLSFLSPSSRSKSTSANYSTLGNESTSTAFRSQNTSYISQTASIVNTQDAMTYYQNMQKRPRSMSSNTLSTTHPLLSSTDDDSSSAFNQRDHSNHLFMFLDEAIQCVRPVAYLHQLHPPRCHRDIKSLNYLVAKSISPHRKHANLGPEIKLADMETVSIVKEEEENKCDDDDQNTTSVRHTRMNSTGFERANSLGLEVPPVAFTPQWCAPEVMEPIMNGKPSLPFEPHSDVYSLTMVIYECLTHEVPFHEEEKFAQIDMLVVQQQKRPKLPHWLPIDLVKLFHRGWNQDPTKRCTAQELLEELINLYSFCGERGKIMMSYQQSVSNATILSMPIYNLVKDRRYRLGTTYESCCLGSELLNFVICHATLFVGKNTNKNNNDLVIVGSDASETKSMEKNDIDDDWTNLPMARTTAVSILQDLVDKKLLQNVNRDSSRFEENGTSYYYIFPKRWRKSNNKTGENETETMMAMMKYG
jgi:hypothetical protein